MLYLVAEVDEPLFFHIVHNVPAANSAQTMLSVADGKAPCHQPLTTKAAAPTRFNHWKTGERPSSLPRVTRM
jgi:hypothetical protein